MITTPDPPPLEPTNSEQAHIGALVERVVRVLDDVVGQAVDRTVGEAFAQLEQFHARDLNALAERFEAALDRQEQRQHELLARLLEHQDARLREVLTTQARVQTDELRAAMREAQVESKTLSSIDEKTALPMAVEELQETVRLGFGELRAALDRGHHELTKVRAECVALTAALSRLARPPGPRPAEARDEKPPPAPRPPPSLARSPPPRDDRAASQRRLEAIHPHRDHSDDTAGDPPRDSPRDPSPDDQPQRPQEVSA